MGWRNWRDRKAGALGPDGFGRALDRASRADRRADARLERSYGHSVIGRRAPRTMARVAGLPEATCRQIVLRLQRERTADDWPLMLALRVAHCGWRPEEVHELLALALEEIGQVPPQSPVFAECLELPLAACEELDPAERGPLQPQLRTLMALCPDCRTDGSRRRFDVATRARALLALSFDPDRLLPPSDGFASSVRCTLGATLYEEPVLRLLELCARLESVRPPAEWLGSVRELLAVSDMARETVGTLLALGRGRQDARECQGHRKRLYPSRYCDALLTPLAWAASVADDMDVLQQLDRTLAAHLGPSDNEQALGGHRFVRAGIAVLASLGRKAELQAELTALLDLPGRIQDLGLRVPVDVYTAVFSIDSRGRADLRFRNSRRFLKQVPAPVRDYHPDLYAALRARLAELRTRLETHRGTLVERLHADPGTPAADWYTAHLDDLVLRPLSCALVWQADTPFGPVTGLPVRRRRSGPWMLRGLDGRLHELTDDTTVRLWNPGLADAREALAWRRELSARRIRQPVPQVV